MRPLNVLSTGFNDRAPRSFVDDPSLRTFLKRCNQRAGHRGLARAAVVDQGGKNRFNAKQISQPGTHINEFLLCELSRFVAVRAVVERQQSIHLVEAEAKALRRLNKSDTRHIGFAVAPDAAMRSVRLWQQPFALVEPDRFHVDASRLREGPNAQVVGLHTQTA